MKPYLTIASLLEMLLSLAPASKAVTIETVLAAPVRRGYRLYPNILLHTPAYCFATSTGG